MVMHRAAPNRKEIKMFAANVVSALNRNQAAAMKTIEALSKADKAEAQKALNELLARAWNLSALHSIRLQARLLHGLSA